MNHLTNLSDPIFRPEFLLSLSNLVFILCIHLCALEREGKAKGRRKREEEKSIKSDRHDVEGSQKYSLQLCFLKMALLICASLTEKKLRKDGEQP